MFSSCPEIISLLSVELAVIIVFIDSDVPLGEELLRVNGSWQQHRAGWWWPVTRSHTRVINWPPWQQGTSAPLTVMHTWTKCNSVPSFLRWCVEDRWWLQRQVDCAKESNMQNKVVQNRDVKKKEAYLQNIHKRCYWIVLNQLAVYFYIWTWDIQVSPLLWTSVLKEVLHQCSWWVMFRKTNRCG